MLRLTVKDAKGQEIVSREGEQELSLFCRRTYEEGDRILLESSEKDCFLWLQIDDALGRSLIYLKDTMEYVIPFGEKRINKSPKAFCGDKHLIWVKRAKEFEIKAYRNLAFNVNDQAGITTCYPHASANVETRGESVFAAVNAIDGVTANESHGMWPFESWGINCRDDALIRVDFGREVEIDRIILYTRADFPHDNWWEQATICYSDGSREKISMQKSTLPHEFMIEKKKVTWIELRDLIKADDPSPFPALTQIEVYGNDL
ncbi:MAG: carbohydrate-binding protein [Lachnospiraceae bacterium]|nr:carbohydrate-binding protein [Lachnospiraceae bacterium]